MSTLIESAAAPALGYGSGVPVAGRVAVGVPAPPDPTRAPIGNIGYWGHGAVTEREAQTTLVRELAGRVPGIGESRVLDVDCGLGGRASLIAAEYGAQVDAISASSDEVDAARAFAVAGELEGSLRFHVASATALPFDDGAFDAIFSLEVAHRLGDKAKFVREAHRVLRPGGRIVLSDITATVDLPVARRLPGVGPDLVTARRWKVIFEQAGFELLEHRLLGRDIYAGYRRWLMLTAAGRRRDILAQISSTNPDRRPVLVRHAQAWLLEFAANRSAPGLTSAMRLQDYVLVVARRPPA
jgi:SAM-dependent methyltransferase